MESKKTHFFSTHERLCRSGFHLVIVILFFFLRAVASALK